METPYLEKNNSQKAILKPDFKTLLKKSLTRALNNPIKKPYNRRVGVPLKKP